MGAFELAFNAVVPVFLVMALGYVLRCTGLCTEELANRMNRLVFVVFLPTMLFWNVYSSDFSAVFRPDMVVFCLVAITASWVVAALIAWRAVPDPGRRAVIIQGMCRSNYVIFGVPIAAALFGQDNVGVAATLIAFVVLAYNAYAVILFSLNQGEGIEPRVVVHEIVTNPLIIAAVLAFIFSGFELSIPDVVGKAVVSVSNAATPLALIVLGANFKLARVGANTRALTVTLAVKLIVLPACFITAGVLAGYSGVELGTLLAMSASPAATSCYTMAREMGGDAELAGQITVLSTAACVATMFCWIFGLSLAGLL